MKPNPAKVQVLQDLLAPANQKELQSFLCLIDYLQSFIPYLSDKATSFRAHITSWDWDPSNDSAFQQLKP